MKRQLSHAIIFILVMICPLTFSTDKVPDFKPACDVSSTQKKDTGTTIVCERSSGESSLPVKHEIVAQIFYKSPFAIPTDNIRLTSRSRSP